MRRDITLALILRGAGALAWLGYTWVLARVLPPEALGVTLYALALAGLLGGLLVAGWAGHILRAGSNALARGTPDQFASLLNQSHRALLLRGAAVCLGLTLLNQLGLLPRLASLPLALLCGFSALLLAFMGSLTSAQRAQGALKRAMLAQGVLKAGLAWLALLGCLMIWPASPVLALAGFSAGVVLILIWLLSTLPRPCWNRVDSEDQQTIYHLWKAQAGGLLLTHLDVLVLGWMLSPVEAALYLVARRLAGLLALVFDGLRAALAPRLAVAFRSKAGFGPLSARVNLGFLLLGAGTAGVLVLTGPLVLPLFGPSFGEAHTVFLWLTLGQATPVFFGATGMLMVMSDMEKPRARLVWSLLPLGFGLLLWAGSCGMVELAIAACALQLTLGGVSAVLLALRHGVLPGITALLYPRLKLS